MLPSVASYSRLVAYLLTSKLSKGEGENVRFTNQKCLMIGYYRYYIVSPNFHHRSIDILQKTIDSFSKKSTVGN